MMIIANPIFRMGDHVRLSELGASRLKKAPSKTGRIVGAGKASKLTIRVLFDGMKRPVSLHQSYLELDER
jgi:hypothetical protein